jgi:hypothetical protein
VRQVVVAAFAFTATGIVPSFLSELLSVLHLPLACIAINTVGKAFTVQLEAIAFLAAA